MHLDWWTMALQTVNFAILVWLLHRFLYRPVLRMIDARKAEIAQQYDDAKAADQQAQTQLADVEAQRAGIAAEREAALRAAAAQAQEAARARHAQAERDATGVARRRAKDVGGGTRAGAGGSAQSRARPRRRFRQRLLADVPIELRAEARIERVEQYLGALQEPEPTRWCSQLADGQALTVVIAVPVPPPTAELWTERLRRKLGADIAVDFRGAARDHRRRGAAFPGRHTAFHLAERARRGALGDWRPCRRSLRILRTGSREAAQRFAALALEPRLEHIGRVTQVGDGVAIVRGLPDTRLDELLIFAGGVRGLAVDLDEETIGCVLLGGTRASPPAASSTAPARSRAFRSATPCSAAWSTRSARRSTAGGRSWRRASRPSSSRRPRSSTGRW